MKSLVLLVISIACLGSRSYGKEIHRHHRNDFVQKQLETGHPLADNVSLRKRDVRSLNILEDINKFALSTFHSRNRVVRNIEGLSDKIPEVAEMFRGVCENNTELDESIDKMPMCILSKPLFVTRRDKYIKHFDSCTATTQRILKECLPPDEQYMPEVLFEMTEAVIKVLYDDRAEITRGLAPCFPLLRTVESEIVYRKCLANITLSESTTADSREVFCMRFIPTTKCYETQINATCNLNSDLEKFTKDYLDALRQPCLQFHLSRWYNV